MTVALLVGAGEVGSRAGRQLVDTPGLDRVLVADRDPAQSELVVQALGARAEAVPWSPGAPLPADASVVVCALPAGLDVAVVHAAIRAGRPAATATDDHDALGGLLDLDAEARAAGTTVAAGCGLAPGLADVLARHAADALDAVDEIHVARTGAAGPASRSEVRQERRSRALEWRDGAWRDGEKGSDALVWFPDPIGGRECRLVASGVGLLATAFPAAARITVRMGEPRVRRFRRHPDDEWGAARVEVWGRVGQARETIVYGVVERTAVAAGTTLAVVAAQLLGLDPATPAVTRPGVAGLAELVDPVPFLAELARRGVRAAALDHPTE